MPSAPDMSARISTPATAIGKADGGEHAESAANIVGHHKGLVALRVREALERAARAVGRGVDALCRARLAVLFLKQRLEEAEGDRRLSGRAGLGDDVHREIHVLHQLVDLLERRGGEPVADEVDVWGVLLFEVVVRGAKAFHNAARSEVGPANADDHQRAGVGLDLLRSLFYARELVAVILLGQGDPAEEVIALSAAVLQPFCRLLKRGAKRVLAGLGEEGSSLGNVNSQHGNSLLCSD